MKNKRKILFTATLDSHILLFHLPYLKYFKENGYEVHVATNTDENIPFCDKKIKIPIERSPYNIKNVKAIFALKKIVLKNKYNIIHTHTPMGSVVTRLASKRARKKYGTRVIYTAHGFHFYKGAPKLNWLLFYPVEKCLSRYTDDIITINQEDYELAKAKFKSNIHYVPGVGLDENKFNIYTSENEKLSLRKSLNLKSNDFVLMYAAELNKNKNQIFLLRAMKLLVNTHPNIHLLLAGDGELYDYYKKITDDFNIKNNVHFLGFRTDIARLLNMSNIAVSSSLREGLPVNIIEAMCVGLPIVATYARGITDLIEDNKNGYIVEKNNIKDFVNKIQELYSDFNKRKSFGNENINKIKPYLLENVKKSIIDIYNPKKKIMFYTMSMQKGGAERVISIISNYLIEKYDVVIVTNINDISYYKLNNNIKYINLDKSIQNNTVQKIYRKIGYIRTSRLKKIILKEKPNVILSFLPEPSFRILSLKKKLNIPIIVSDRNDPNIEYKNPIVNKIMRNLYKKADGFVFQTSDAKDYMKNIVKCRNIIIPNPIASDFIVECYKGTRKKTIVTVGRLTKQKNHKLLIDAFKKIVNVHPEYELYIYGDGDLKANLEKYIVDNNLNKKVILKGITNDLKNEIYNAGMFVLSSDYEGMPNVLMEAMALGLPCISTDCSGGGARFLMKNNINGILIPTNDVDSMSEAINRIIDDNEYARNLGKQANISLKKYDTNLICKKWEEYIESYLEE